MSNAWDWYTKQAQRLLDSIGRLQPFPRTANEPEGPRYVGFQNRLLAMTIDSILLLVILLPFMHLLPGNLEDFAAAQQNLAAAASDEERMMIARQFLMEWCLSMGIQTLILLIAFWWMWERFGASPGKWLLRMQIVDTETLGPITKWQSFVRSLGYLISTIPFCLGFLWIVFDKRKQGWHDKMAGTVVVHIPAKAGIL